MRRYAALAGLVALVLVTARCIDLKPPGGTLKCAMSGKTCPDGYSCVAGLGTCWPNDALPDQDMGAGGNGGGGGGNGGGGGDGGTSNGPAARPIWPLSAGTVSSQRPTLQWALPDGATNPVVELCASRDCASVTATIPADASGHAARPAAALTPGWVWWRIRATTSAGTSYSAVWQFFVRPFDTAVDTSFGTTLDLDGDGRSEVAIGAPAAPVLDMASPPGRVYVYAGKASGFGSDAPVVLEGDAPASRFGASVAAAGDVNGDGYPDLLVGAPEGSPFGAPNAGRAYIYLGGPAGVAKTPWATLDGADGANSQFAVSLSGAGDVDHDGYADVVISAGGALNGVGRVYVYRGGAGGMTALPVLEAPDAPTREQFGASVAAAGDVDGNAYSDIIAGVPQKMGGGGFYVLLGSKDGFTMRASRGNDNFNSMGMVSGGYGQTVAGNGDANGDGYSEVIAGCEQCTPQYGTMTYYTNGYATWYAGSTNLQSSYSSVKSLPGPMTGSECTYGYSAVLGDVDGDGRADAVVGSHYEAQARYFQSSAAGLDFNSFTLAPSGIASFGNYGNAVAMADVDGDGKAEIFVGAPDGVGTDLTEVFVYKGKVTANSPTPIVKLTCPDGAGTGFGSAIAGQ